jgi:acetylornithine deacetylase/succinyl-diaminopimelate desuccinylase-like protein
MEGWREGTGPTTPAIIDGKLYGRGASDDCYVPFAGLLAIENALA